MKISINWYNILIGLTLLLGLTFYSKTTIAQEPSTIGEIYNFDVGDIFQIEFWGSYWGGGDSDVTDIEIIGKYFSEDEGTVFYARYIKYKYSSSDEPWMHYSYYTDTISYGDLDGILTSDSVFTDDEYYNGRKISMSWWSGSTQYIEHRYADGLGEVKYYYDCWDSEEPAEALRRLTYYKKGDEEWGDYQIVTIPESLKKENSVSAYPNPCKDIITFDFGDQYEGYYELNLFTIQGIQLKSFLINSGKTTINISQLSSGVYFYTIIDANFNMIQTEKIIIP